MYQKDIAEKLGIDNLRTELSRLENQPIINQYMSAKKVLSTILLNSDTNSILDEYIVSYLKLNPSLVTKYMDENGLYHVYYRHQDSNTDPDSKAYGPFLLKSFATEKEAEAWLLKMGHEIVEFQEDNWGRPVVLMIIEDSNDGDYEYGEAHEHGISDKMAPTYAFSKQGYKMLKKELKYNNKQNPTWIHYIK